MLGLGHFTFHGLVKFLSGGDFPFSGRRKGSIPDKRFLVNRKSPIRSKQSPPQIFSLDIYNPAGIVRSILLSYIAMAEVQQRSSGSRGRGSARGGRGGYVSRGGRPKAPSTGKENTHPTGSYEDQGEIGQLKKQYASQLETIKEMFPDWTSEDLVFALQETGGNLESTINRISEGAVFPNLTCPLV